MIAKPNLTGRGRYNLSLCKGEDNIMHRYIMHRYGAVLNQLTIENN